MISNKVQVNELGLSVKDLHVLPNEPGEDPLANKNLPLKELVTAVDAQQKRMQQLNGPCVCVSLYERALE